MPTPENDRQALRCTIEALRRENAQLGVELDAMRSAAESNHALRRIDSRENQGDQSQLATLGRLARHGPSDGFWYYVPATGYVWYSDSFFDLLGVPANERRSLASNLDPFLDRLHPRDLDRTVEAVRLHLEDRVPYDIEYRLRRSDGSYRWFRACGQAHWGEDGNPLRMTGSIQDIEAQVFAREAVYGALEERKILALVAQRTDSAVVITDRDVKIEWVNEAFTRITGYTADEAIGRNPGQLLQGPETDPETVRAMREGLRAGQGFDVELVNYRKDGTKYWLAIEVRPVSNAEGEVERFVAVERDITEARARNERVRLLESAVENARDGMLTVAADGRVIDANSAACGLLGFERTALVGLRIWDIRPTLGADQWGDYWDHLSEHGRSTYESMFHGADRRLPVSLSETMLHHDGTQYVSIFFRDISKRIEMERELSAERRLLREIVSTIPYQVFWKDTECRYLGCNRAFAEAAGLSSPAAVVGLTDDELPWRPDEVERFRAHDRAVLEQAAPQLHLEEQQTQADGSTRTLDTSKVPLRNQSDEVVGILGVLADITEQKALQAQVAQTHKLESIGQLAAGIAHEINTPTQYVGDNTRFLEEAFEELLEPLQICRQITRTEGSSPELVEELRNTVRNSDLDYLLEEVPRAITQSTEGISRVTSIVKAMKDFSHPSEGLADADLNRAIESTVTVARNEWKYVAKMELALAPDLPPVPCRVEEINQVVLNMIVNAAHAISDVVGQSGEQGVITIATAAEAGFVEIRISDTGTGMSPEVRDRIFDPFYSTKEVGKGTGQGLAMAHNVIRNNHAGEISVDTEVGRGSTFTVRLPLEPARSEA